MKYKRRNHVQKEINLDKNEIIIAEDDEENIQNKI